MKPLRFAALLLAFIMTVTTGVTLSPKTAHAEITITPTIVVIEGRQRYADLNLVNTGDDTKTYEMKWRFFRQEENTGTYINSDASTTEFDLAKHLVFTPRRVTLAPGSVQKIRLGLRLQGEPPVPGDYRGHFEIMEVEAPANPDALDSEGKKKVSVSVHVNVGFSIPVVYRVGEPVVTASIGEITTGVNQKSGKIEATIPVTRSAGTYGILGHIFIYYKGPDGSEKQVGELKNANIFAEITRRVFVLPLETPTLSGGTLRIVYKDETRDKKTVYAEKTLQIGR